MANSVLNESLLWFLPCRVPMWALRGKGRLKGQGRRGMTLLWPLLLLKGHKSHHRCSLPSIGSSNPNSLPQVSLPHSISLKARLSVLTTYVHNEEEKSPLLTMTKYLKETREEGVIPRMRVHDREEQFIYGQPGRRQHQQQGKAWPLWRHTQWPPCSKQARSSSVLMIYLDFYPLEG